MASAALLVLAAGAFCIFSPPAFLLPRSHGKISYSAENLDALIRDSPVIVVARVTRRQTTEKYLGVWFIHTRLDVERVLKGRAGDRITLTQTVMEEDPTVRPGGAVALFLDPYNGPVPGAAGSYVCQGLYQGNYTVENGALRLSYENGDGRLAADVARVGTVNALQRKIAAVKAE